MKRAIKIIFTINLVIAILAVGGYILYGLAHGLPIDKHFLGSDPPQRPAFYSISKVPWTWTAFIEAILLVALPIMWLRWRDLKGHRILCGIWGLVNLLVLLLALMRADTYTGDEFDYLQIPRIDRVMGFYVWGSHILYGLTALLDLDGI